MKLSVKSEYACLAMIVLAKNYGKGYMKTSDVATAHEIPKKYLEQILLALKNGGFVQSKMGADGGYQLAKPPVQIHLAEIIRLMDGALAPVLSVSRYFYESTPVERCDKLLQVFSQIRDFISEKLEHTTLADLV